MNARRSTQITALISSRGQSDAEKATRGAAMAFIHDAFKATGFESFLIPIPPPAHDPTLSVTIYALRFRSSIHAATNEPLLLLHGHPQNSIIYRHLGPALAKSSGRDIVIADTRGSGMSTAPKVRNFSGQEGALLSSEILRLRYSKREMGKDMVHVMCVLSRS